MNRLRIPLLLTLLASFSCAAPVILAGFGAAVGIWTYDDFSNDRGEILIHGSAQQVYAIAQSVGQERAGAGVESMPGTMRVEWVEDKATVACQVMIMPDAAEFCTLKVYAAELGIRGRGELAKEVAEDIAARL